MSQNKRERSRDKEKKNDEIIENKTSSSDSNKDSNKEPNKDSNDSSNSNSYLFQTEENKDSINVKKVSISGTNNLFDKISNIDSPCILKNKEFIDKLPKDIKDEEMRIIPNSFFEKLKKEDIIYIDKNFNIIPKIKNSIIFNSNLFDKINENDKKIFDKFHNYLTAFYKSSKISDFCFDKNIYFPFSYNDTYYEIKKRENTYGFRAHHYDGLFGNITHHFGIKGIGKSLCGRAIIYNYLHFKILKSGDVFFPAIFFNYKLLNERLYDKPFLLYILKYETINLFRKHNDWINFYEEIKKSLKNNSVISIITQIASLYISKFEKQKFLIIIDQYSNIYDEDKDIESIKLTCKDMKIFDLFIIYSIETIEDQTFFINKFIKNTYIVSEPLDMSSPNFIRFENNEVSCYYKYEFRNYKLLKKYFPEDIPEKYKDYFGKNISYYFQFKSNNNGILFDNFVKQIKNQIAENIYFFYKNNYDSYQRLNDILSKIISNENKIINKNIELFENINGSYFLFYKYYDKKNNITYKYKYAFPLVKDIYEDFLKATNINFFIDIKSPNFLQLDGISMGVCFDNFMNWWFKKKSESKLFEFSSENIEVINIDYLIKKNTKNFNIKTMYKKEFILKEIDENEDLKKIRDQFNISISKKCLLIFQKFNAKSIDILFVIKINDDWVLNAFQIKCSDNFEIDEKLLFENKYEMTYLSNKIKLLFKINIIKSFITYISIYEIPKLCAKQNEDKFIYYNIKDDKLVNKNNQELINIPFYDGCKIPFVDEINENKILEFAKSYVAICHLNLAFNIIPAIKDEVIVDGIQKNNSIILTIIKNEINLTSIVNQKINQLKNKNYDEILHCEKYYKVQIINNN